jgi:putative DNA primase/helicase
MEFTTGTGADLTRVTIIKMKKMDGKDYMFSLIDDLELLERKIKQFGNVALVGIDPVTAYLGVKKIDSYRTTDVRGVLAPLAAMAARLEFACILITHFNKNTMSSVLNRITDSMAFVASGRHCYVVVPEADSDRTLFLRAKNNLARKGNQDGLAYTLEEKIVEGNITTSHIVWDDEPVTVTANEALAVLRGNGGRPPKEVERAKDLLKTMLEDGPVPAEKVYQRMEGYSVSKSTVNRAACELAVIKTGAKGRDGTSTWSLPKEETPLQQ